jgi:hypothetical protein
VSGIQLASIVLRVTQQKPLHQVLVTIFMVGVIDMLRVLDILYRNAKVRVHSDGIADKHHANMAAALCFGSQLLLTPIEVPTPVQLGARRGGLVAHLAKNAFAFLVLPPSLEHVAVEVEHAANRVFLFEKAAAKMDEGGGSEAVDEFGRGIGSLGEDGIPKGLVDGKEHLDQKLSLTFSGADADKFGVGDAVVQRLVEKTVRRR